MLLILLQDLYLQYIREYAFVSAAENVGKVL